MSAPHPQSAPRPSKGDRTRARILDAATALFSRSGFHAVSLRDIAAHAGLTHAGLLHHFPGKEALLTQVLSRRDAEDAARLFPPDASGDPTERLMRLVYVVARNAHTPGLVGLYAKLSGEASDPEHPAHDYFVERYRLLRERTTVLFARLFAEHEPPLPHDPASVAQQLLALMDGLQTQWLLEPAAVDMQASVRAYLTELGLVLPPTPWTGEPAPGASPAPEGAGAPGAG
ncbi:MULTISPECIES: TetR/AcrR family transcriptional regulator [unclassified Streptomyces]|uniref:TetR/AcrR family transcriptional regulator n=1 Tax=unclassified Streptomyces TaxID=2593676 RepID=UPI000BAC67CE|nr:MULTISPECIES: TetR/AcrR family transcriptional regulator [unclassified Streptomyces]ASY36268.1 TetR family transcriptional regulator [Streptomyces sp. CLI2509]MYX23882.1 TetR family transcriptional regulator [Streptomyces sp. SID8380]